MEPVLRRRVWSELDEAGRRALEQRDPGIFDPALRAQVRGVMDDVAAHGDAAIVRALARFDGCDVAPDRLVVSPDDIERAYRAIDDGLLRAIRAAHDRIRRFNERAVAHAAGWEEELEPGLVVGERSTPIASVGLYVPCGKGSFPSTMLMLGTPARVAGVPVIVAVVPPVPGTGGEVDPAVVVAAAEAGVPLLVRANGVAGIAALAHGTETVPQVVKILGPGSPPIAAAQIEAQARGTVGYMVFGPSEALVVADESADPVLIATDLLIEAEHGDDSTALLVTPSAALIEAVEAAIAPRLAALPEPRRSWAAASLQNGGAMLVGDLDEALEVANRFAPEHLQLAVADPQAALAAVLHAGEVLVGQATPFSAANYVLGVPHTLPTSGYARVSSGVSAQAFLKTVSTARLDAAGYARIAPDGIALSEHEGFPAHAAALRVAR